MAEEITTEKTSKKKNWFVRHKILTVILVILVLIVIGGSTNKSTNNNNSSSNNNSGSQQSASKEKTYRFSDRLDQQKTDVEVLPGETATVDGVKMTLTNPEYKTSLDQYTTAESGKIYVVVQVNLENIDKKTHAYNVFNFRIQTAGGQVLDANFSSAGSPLDSGDIVAGGKVNGSVTFLVPQEKGNQYVIWKPNSSRSDRAIVQLKQQ